MFPLSGGSARFPHYGAHGILLAVAVSGIIFSYLGFEQADQLAGESSNPKRDIPIAVIGSIVRGVIIYIALQTGVHVGVAAQRDRRALVRRLRGRNGGNEVHVTCRRCDRRRVRRLHRTVGTVGGLIGLAWLGTLLRIDAVISPGGTGLIYLAAGSRVSTDCPATDTSPGGASG